LGWRDFNLVIILGAGASKPLGIPTSKEIVAEFLETQSSKPLSLFKEKIIAEQWDIEKLMRLMQHIRVLGIDPPLKTIFGSYYTQRLEKKVNELNIAYESVYKELLNFIRAKCLHPDVSKATEIYKPLLALKEEATIKIFTTNYDLSIENVCKDAGIEYNDGFEAKGFDEYKTFYPENLGRGNPQLYKLHGSVNWWSDEQRKNIFRLSLDLKGVEGLRTMMIYPADIESAFNYPFNILQSYYTLSLMDANMVIAVGHKFGGYW
jgi:hypothetical protein